MKSAKAVLYFHPALFREFNYTHQHMNIYLYTLFKKSKMIIEHLAILVVYVSDY